MTSRIQDVPDVAETPDIGDLHVVNGKNLDSNLKTIRWQSIINR